MWVRAIVLRVVREEYSRAEDTNPLNDCVIVGIESVDKCFGEDGSNCVMWNVSNGG